MFSLLLEKVRRAGKNAQGAFGALANVYEDASPCLATTLVSPVYLYERCRRVQWSDLSEEWQRAFLLWMEDWDQPPEQIRGFWQVKSSR